DRPAQLYTLSESDWLANARRIAPACPFHPDAFESKAQLEVLRQPLGIILRGVLEPTAEVRAQILDLRAPHARNGRSELFLVLMRDPLQRGIGVLERLLKPARIHGEESGALQISQHGELNGVEQRPAR